ncbi:MAG: hypothetical protein ACXWND_13905, partial [Gemmatimonadaceae bacterium]
SDSFLGDARIPGWFWASTLSLALVACGPPLSEPSSHDISGRWVTSAVIGPLTQIQIDITQNADGTLEGQWSGKTSSPDAPCPPELGSSPTGPVNGTNTVLEIRFEVLGAGDFQGQLADDQTLRGSFRSCGGFYAVSFALVGPVPGG